MNKKLPLISLFIMSIVSIFYWTLKPKEELHDAKWNASDTTLAITIDGEISTTFPTTAAYETSVECTSGSGKVEWNGTKWVITTNGITKGSTKCNANFEKIKAPEGWFEAKDGTLLAALREENTLKSPLTIPGKEVSAHTIDDVDVMTKSVSTTYQAYYVTYGTGWEASGTRFNLTGTAVTSNTYANSYSSLVGKYISDSNFYFSGSSTSGEMKTTTNLSNVYYVVSATSSSFVYKQITSNKNTTEALLASTEDDYGTSYYFRGAVKNNYVEFANKCWRIVRITGDGSVKLLLHNDNINSVSNPCSSANNSDEGAFAHYKGDTYKYQNKFNSGATDNAHVGFMYGNTGASDYASTHANKNKSTILTNLEAWYTDNLTSYESKLADTIWCNDKSTISGGLGYGTNATKYAAFNRVDSQPTLKCPNDNNGGKLSKFTVSDTINGNGDLTYKIGLLTADEIAFSGSVLFAINYSTYLQENTAGSYWWTMSPYRKETGNALVFRTGSGSLHYEATTSYSSNSGYLRPAISLISSITISGGSGTASNPYIIN